MVARFAWLLSRGRDYWISFVPDDAFYYLGFGRGLATRGRWTFDGGVSPSSGFHVLQGYVAASCWALFHGLSDNAPVYALMGVSAACAVLAMLVCTRVVARVFGEHATLAVALVFLGKNALVCGASAMEWSVAVLMLALVSELAIMPAQSRASGSLVACVCAFLAVLARSDSALWVGVAAVASLVAYGASGIKRSVALCAGATFGSAAVAVQAHAITGVWLQDSVVAKLSWAAQRGVDLSGALNTIAMATGVSWLGKGFDRGVLLTLTLAALAGAAVVHGERRVALLTGALTLLGTLALGAKNSGGLQYWYTDAAVVPCCLIWAAALAEVQHRANPPLRWVAAGVAVCCFGNLTLASAGPWQNQPALLHAALHLNLDEWSMCRVGAWNAGIIGYYRGHDVINLDGLANHDALIASSRGRLSEYLTASRVRYIVDFGAMLERKEFRERGGYDRPEDLRLTEVERAPASDPRWLSSSIVYWRRGPRLNSVLASGGEHGSTGTRECRPESRNPIANGVGKTTMPEL